MKKEEIREEKVLISALITFVGVALFILSILDSWNLAFLIPGVILFFFGMVFGILYGHKIKIKNKASRTKFLDWIIKKLRKRKRPLIEKFMKKRLEKLKEKYNIKKKRLEEIIKKSK